MRRKILIVDDDTNVLRLMSYIAEEEDYTVVTVDSGAAALTTIAREHPQLVILDLVMPDISGFQICEHIRNDPDLADIKILAVTGYAEPSNLRRILALGADEYVEKPLDVEDFIGKVRRLATH